MAYCRWQDYRPEIMNWRDHISVDPNVMHGVAYITGTRIPVSLVLDNLAARVPEERLLAEHPSLTREAIQAVFSYAAEFGPGLCQSPPAAGVTP
jgi:uncharacterized protein (DUF433 family)